MERKERAKVSPQARLAAFIKAEAGRLGFAAAGITRADAIDSAGARLMTALAEGRLASMTWMNETAARRASPAALWPETRTIVSLGLDYGPDEDPLAVNAEPTRGGISVYARNRDYHDVLKGRLKELAGRMIARARALGLDGAVKVFVDTAPVLEKPLAAAAGLGWQGKHTNLVSRERGSWLFLGEIFTSFDLPSDTPETDHCGSCRRCLDACPTNAFPAPYQLDARRCISYLTIEHAGPIPIEFRAAMGNRIYGCDDCLAVCPWNKFAAVAAEAKLAAREDLLRPALADLARLNDAGFRALFTGSPIKRIGRDRFMRNVLIAIGNSGDPTLADNAIARFDDPSPLVRGAAVWALMRLLPGERFLALRAARLPAECDPDVRAEWGEVTGVVTGGWGSV